MLFNKGNPNDEGVVKEAFTDFIMNDIKVPNIEVQAVKVLLRTHELLHRRHVITR